MCVVNLQRGERSCPRTLWRAKDTEKSGGTVGSGSSITLGVRGVESTVLCTRAAINTPCDFRPPFQLYGCSAVVHTHHQSGNDACKGSSVYLPAYCVKLVKLLLYCVGWLPDSADTTATCCAVRSSAGLKGRSTENIHFPPTGPRRFFFWGVFPRSDRDKKADLTSR